MGIGLTMSILITNLAFVGNAAEITGSKMAILLASLVAETTSFLLLKLFGRPTADYMDADTMDFHVAEV